MNLSEFIKETLIEIATGIKESQDKIKELGGISSPAIISVMSKSDTQGFLGKTTDGRYAYFIDFDITVQVSETTAQDGKGKLQIGVFSVGGNIAQDASTNSLNHIRFRIPFSPPVDAETEKERLDEQKRVSDSVRDLRPY